MATKEKATRFRSNFDRQLHRIGWMDGWPLCLQPPNHGFCCLSNPDGTKSIQTRSSLTRLGIPNPEFPSPKMSGKHIVPTNLYYVRSLSAFRNKFQYVQFQFHGENQMSSILSVA
eukprot:6465903-Amphidinium_carterae.1